VTLFASPFILPMSSSNDQMELLVSSPSSVYLEPSQDEDLVRIGFQHINDMVSITQANEILQHNSYPPHFERAEKSYPSAHSPFYTQDTLTSSLIQQFPQSTSLYFAMCDRFGSHNIAPVPQWLSDSSDRVQKQWFKSGPNAFLYFLHKTPKHKARVRALANKSMCCSCKPCVTPHMGNVYDMNPPTHYCRAFWGNDVIGWLCFVPFPCISCATSDCKIAQQHHIRYYGSGHDKRPPSIGEEVLWAGQDCCTAFCECCLDKPTGPAAFHHGMFREINWALGGGTPSPSTSECIPNCCAPCVNTQHHAIIDYLFYKRYGFATSQGPAMTKIFGQDVVGRATWTKHFARYKAPRPYGSLPSYPHAVDHTREAIPSEEFIHRWEESNYNGEGEYTGRTTVTELYHGPFPQYPILLEWTNLSKAVEYHNIIWKDIHKVQLNQTVLDELGKGRNNVKPTALEMG
jgi:hypothetical protein